MKIKSLLIPIAVFIFFTSFCYSVYGQETQIDGKSYETIRKVNKTETKKRWHSKRGIIY